MTPLMPNTYIKQQWYRYYVYMYVTNPCVQELTECDGACHTAACCADLKIMAFGVVSGSSESHSLLIPERENGVNVCQALYSV